MDQTVLYIHYRSNSTILTIPEGLCSSRHNHVYWGFPLVEVADVPSYDYNYSTWLSTSYPVK